MNSQARAIEEFIYIQPENRILTASKIYKQLPDSFSEQAFYQTLTRLTQMGALCRLAKGLYYRPHRSRFGVVQLGEQTIINHYTENGQGMVIGYRLYHGYGITTQISKNVDVLSNVLLEHKKTVKNVKISRLELDFDDSICNAIATLEILQNYYNIEDINHKQLAEYMRKFALNYSEDAIVKVIKARKYKKSTIAFLAAFLGFWNIKHTLHQYLSSLSTYDIPEMEEFYATP